ncbi:WYL domain-containing protein [Saccharopolyspora sp. ASAGF58]|uniref:WYL domain-containing protein n=1 Tax=Saccharopolyspora sp. ASAGF58 TaxID=2719023 RepID=UPI0035302D9D
MVFHSGRWYVTGHDHRSGEARTFRVDRIGSAELRASAREWFWLPWRPKPLTDLFPDRNDHGPLTTTTDR